MRKTTARLVSTGSDHRAVVVAYDLPAPKPEEPAVTPSLARPLWRGRTNVDALTIAALEYAESLRREPGPFVVTQGSYQNTVAASAGTHDGGGVVDLRWTGNNSDILALRKAGFAAWHRKPSQGPWPDHIHAVLGGHPLLARSAANQWTAYVAGRNGLANNGPDDGPRLNPVPTFDPSTPPEDDMPTPAELWRHEIPLEKGEKVPAQLALRWARNESQKALAQSRATDATVRELAAKVDALIAKLEEKP